MVQTIKRIYKRNNFSTLKVVTTIVSKMLFWLFYYKTCVAIIYIYRKKNVWHNLHTYLCAYYSVFVHNKTLSPSEAIKCRQTQKMLPPRTHILSFPLKKKEIRLLLFVAAETINYNTVISILKARGYYLRIFFTIILCISLVSYPCLIFRNFP